MGKLACLIMLALLAIPAMVSSSEASFLAQPSLTFFESAFDDERIVANADGEHQCVCPKSGLCGAQQPIGLFHVRGFLEELSPLSLMKPGQCSLALKSHISELDPPPPRSHLC